MQSLEQYLDATFHSPLELSAKIDDEHKKLASQRANVEIQLQKIQEEAQKRHQEQVERLKQSLSEFSTSVTLQQDQREPLEFQVNHSGDQERQQEQEQNTNELIEDLSQLVAARNTVFVAHQLALATEALKPLLDKQQAQTKTDTHTAKALELYGSIASLQERLQTIASQTQTPAARALAKAALAKIETSAFVTLQTNVQTSLKKYLDANDWPKQVNAVTSPEFVKLFENALKVSASGYESERSSGGQRPPLLAFATLAEPFILRLRFNFSGSQATNRVDKPEWMFSYFITIVDKVQTALATHVQPCLRDGFSDRIALHEFITALLPFVYERLENVIPHLITGDRPSPHIYLHLISELMSFDTQLKSRYLYSPHGVAFEEWGGVTDDLLNQHQTWFEYWLSTEKAVALERYSEILGLPDAFNVDWDSKDLTTTTTSGGGGGGTFYTFSAIHVRDLLAGVTDHYRNLHAVNQRLRVLLDVQIAILDAYYSRLNESLSIFESMSSSMARAVGGLRGEDASRVSGLEGIESLCRTYGSVQCIVDALNTWGQDIFFLDLWQDLCRLNGIDDSTRAALEDSNTGKVPQSEEDDGTLFDETVATYTKLKQRVLLNTNNVLKKELSTSMKPYFQHSQWRLDHEPKAVSSSLSRPLRHLGQLLTHLKRFHSPNDYTRIARTFSGDVSRYFWNHIIQANMFNIEGAMQLSMDISEMIGTFDLPFDNSLKRVQEAVMLLRQHDKVGKTERDAEAIQASLDVASLTIGEIQSLLARRL